MSPRLPVNNPAAAARRRPPALSPLIGPAVRPLVHMRRAKPNPATKQEQMREINLAISDVVFILIATLAAAKCILKISQHLRRKIDSGVESREKNTYKKVDSCITRAMLLIFMVAIGYIFIVMSFDLAYNSIAKRGELNYLALVYSYAWLAYLVMGLFWVADKKIGKIIPATGTIAGTIGTLSVSVFLIPLIPLAPQVVFACYLAKFHSSKQVVER